MNQIIKRMIWRCQACSDVIVSYSNLRHDMNYCDCGKTGVDHEEFYTRICGDNFEVISEKIKINGEWKND